MKLQDHCIIAALQYCRPHCRPHCRPWPPIQIYFGGATTQAALSIGPTTPQVLLALIATSEPIGLPL